jgi:hypothetical protein
LHNHFEYGWCFSTHAFCQIFIGVTLTRRGVAGTQSSSGYSIIHVALPETDWHRLATGGGPRHGEKTLWCVGKKHEKKSI